MTASSTTANVRSAGHRTPAQLYCLLFGAALLLAGLFGFISSSSFSTGSGLEHKSFLGFDVNGWHNIVHLASGVVLLAAANLRPTAKTIAIGFGTVYGIVTIWGLIDGNDVLGIVAINGADNILHLVISALGIVAGMVSPTFNPEGRVGSRLEGR